MATPSRFPRNAGGNQTLTLDRVEFAGYGLDAPRRGHADYRGRDVSGAAVVWLGADGPAVCRAGGFDRRPTGSCSTAAADTRSRNCAPPRASASRVRRRTRGRRTGGGGATPAARGGGRNAIPAADFTTVERLDQLIPPQVTGTDAFFEFLFSHAPVKYDELKRKAEAREALPPFRLDGVTLTFDVNIDYEVVRTQLTQNVVGDRRGHRSAAEDRPTSRSARTTITSATRRAN